MGIREYYPAIKRNEVLSHAAAQMELEFIMLSESIRHEKTNTACCHLHVETKKLISYK